MEQEKDTCQLVVTCNKADITNVKYCLGRIRGVVTFDDKGEE